MWLILYFCLSVKSELSCPNVENSITADFNGTICQTMAGLGFIFGKYNSTVQTGIFTLFEIFVKS